MQVQTDDDLDLIAAAQRGDLRAFNRLVLKYQRLAYAIALRITHDSEEASDATQEAFIKAFRALDQFDGGSFRAWLVRIVTNACYDLVRARKRRFGDGLAEMNDDLEHPAALPDEHVVRSELYEVLQRGIAALPAAQRTTLLLYDVEGFTYQEIAQVTQAEMGTVKSRLSRARALLRDHLRAYWAEPHDRGQPVPALPAREQIAHPAARHRAVTFAA